MKTFPKDTLYKDFDKFDFQPIRDMLDIEKEKRKEKEKEEKDENKRIKAEEEVFYGGAVVDTMRGKIYF